MVVDLREGYEKDLEQILADCGNRDMSPQEPWTAMWPC